MPRKSSKTSHVLNLLAGSEEPDETVQTEYTGSGASDQIEIILPKKSGDPVADIIRARLEAEFSPEDVGEAIEDSEAISEKPQVADYAYVNVMEHILREKVEAFCREFEMCTCSRCLTDIAALALTNLPPKYIVKDSLTVSPLLNYYSNKYFSQITVSLTKASMSVKDNPRH